jgi:pyruvate/2-oxoglutarate dehydrogenase complex dihydrolipoamide dehydrogenase (E3) component
VGLEFAQAYRRFGSRVTVIQHGPQLMAREDPDVAAEVQRILSDEGIQVLVAAETLHSKDRKALGHSPQGFTKAGSSETPHAMVPQQRGLWLCLINQPASGF